MFFKIKDTVLFRQYTNYGFITDNSLFGYRFLNDNSPVLGEKYISQSGAVMLSLLSKTPQNLNIIVEKLSNIFIGVEYSELKQDTFDFFMELVNEGYLCCGDTIDSCIENEKYFSSRCDGIHENGEVNINDCFNKSKQSDFLRSVHIQIVNECNERCVHCYIPHKFKNQVLDSNVFYRLLDECRAMNIIHITLSGGEPLLHKDFLNFLIKCRELDLAVNVLSNLTLLTDEIIQEMKKNPLLSVQTSLYSMDSNIHDSITKVKGSFEKTKSAVLKLIACGIPVQISCPIMKQNKNTFNDVILWGKAHNIAVSYDYVIFASYDSTNLNLVNRLSLEEVGEAFDKQINKDNAIALNETAKEKCLLTGKDSICSICRYYICISPEGNVYPCIGWQTNVVGNIKNTTLKEILESSKEIEKLKNIKRENFPKCVSCEDRGYCTVCMMSNANENPDGDYFKINEFHCKVASLIHSKVDSYLEENKYEQ